MAADATSGDLPLRFSQNQYARRSPSLDIQQQIYNVLEQPPATSRDVSAGRRGAARLTQTAWVGVATTLSGCSQIGIIVVSVVRLPQSVYARQCGSL